MIDRKRFLKLISMGSLGSLTGVHSFFSDASSNVLIPPKLKAGDRIGLISPGMILPDPNRYDEIKNQIQKLGFEVKEAPHARNRYGYLAGTDQQRAADLNNMFADDSVDAIMPFRGGWGCNRILPLINFDLIQQNPKILIGFSDITTLLLAIYAKTGIITFHGPVGKSKWTDYTTEYFKRIIESGSTDEIKIPKKSPCKDCSKLSVITSGIAEGRLLGGNLSVLSAMMGSDYLPEWGNSILFLEDVGEDIYRIDRMLTQLKLNGVLEQISGFVFGQCYSCESSNSYSFSLQQVLEQHIKPLDIPAFSGAMFGHIDNMITLPVGIRTRIDGKKGIIQPLESAVG
jgi:muramoyltetrapeptide carboxypeptidase